MTIKFKTLSWTGYDEIMTEMYGLIIQRLYMTADFSEETMKKKATKQVHKNHKKCQMYNWILQIS